MSSTLIVPLVFGWSAGWLVNYLADVLPVTRRFSRAVCQQCQIHFTLKEYLFFLPCKNGHSRSARHWIFQLLILTLSMFTWINPPTKLGYFLGLLIIIYFGVIFVIDMEHRLILHPTSFFGAILGLLVGTVAHGIIPSLLGGLGSLLIMLAIYYFGVLFTRARTKRLIARGQEPDQEEALGAGDVILLTILGFILGWPLIWFCLLMGVLLGGFFSLLTILWMVLRGGYRENALMTFIPYGPYFIASAFLILYFPSLLKLILPG